MRMLGRRPGSVRPSCGRGATRATPGNKYAGELDARDARRRDDVVGIGRRETDALRSLSATPSRRKISMERAPICPHFTFGGSFGGRRSATMTSMPRQARSIASVSPTGPPPTASTLVLIPPNPPAVVLVSYPSVERPNGEVVPCLNGRNWPEADVLIARSMSAFGTKRTSQLAQPMSAFGGIADIDRSPRNVRYGGFFQSARHGKLSGRPLLAIC